MPVILETPRLVLRELNGADLDFVADMLADPDVMRFSPAPYTRAEAGRWIERQQARYARDGQGLWLAAARSNGEPHGTVGLLWQDVNGAREPEVAYVLHRPYWGEGLATEAARATRDYAFATLEVPRVVSLVRPDNPSAQAVARKLEMTIVGRAPHDGVEHLVFAVRALRRGPPAHAG